MNKLYKLSLLGIGHLIVDLQGIYLINYINHQLSFKYIAIFFIIYNLIAFGFQIVVGFITDIYNLYFSCIVIGLIISMIAMQFPSLGIIVVIISALGNALYHIGGGVLSVNLFPKKAAPAGIFVAPGAIGVFLGVFLALSDINYRFYISIVAIIVVILLYLFFKDDLPKIETSKVNKNMIYIIFLVFIIVFIRGFIGTILLLPWKSNIYLGAVLVLGIVFGKLFGGILGDRFGYKTVGIVGLAGSLPFLILGYYFAVLALIGAFLFNLTMAITLFIIIDSFGKYKGFAFGVTTLSLFLSYLPNVIGLSIDFSVYYTIFVTTLVIAGIFVLNKIVNLYEKGRCL